MSAYLDQAAALGFLCPHKYAHIERERRWLCDAVPDSPVRQTQIIEDRYIDNSAMRLRVMRDPDSGETEYKLSKKGDLSPERRLITTIYLTRAEYDLLSALPGTKLEKTRFHLDWPGAALSVDAFAGPLTGLFLAEAEFETDEDLAAFPDPLFALRDVTADARYTGGRLIKDGPPRAD